MKTPFWFLFCFGYLGQLISCLKCDVDGQVVRLLFLQHILILFLNIFPARSQQLLKLSVLFPSYKRGRKSPEHKRDAGTCSVSSYTCSRHIPLPQASLRATRTWEIPLNINLLSMKYTDLGKRIYLRYFISVKDLNLRAHRKQLLSYFGEVICEFKEHWTQHANQYPPVKGKSSQEEFKRSPRLNSFYLRICKYICVGNKGIAINMCSNDIHRGLFSISSFFSFPCTPSRDST